MAKSEFLTRVIETRNIDLERGAKTVYTSPGMGRVIDHADRLEGMIEELQHTVTSLGLALPSDPPRNAALIDEAADLLARTDLSKGGK